MKLKVSLAIIYCLLLNLILMEALVSIRSVDGAVLLKAGDWIKYYEYSDEVNQYWIFVNVLDVNETSLKVRVVRVYIPDGKVTENTTIICDVNDVLWYNVFPLIIPKDFDLNTINLTKKLLWPAWNFTFQTGETIRKYGKAVREIITLNGTYNCGEFQYTALHNFEFRWDKTSGLLLEIVDIEKQLYTEEGVQFNEPRTYFLLQVSETSLWTDPAPTPNLFDTAAKATLIMVFPTALAFIVWRKQETKKGGK